MSYTIITQQQYLAYQKAWFNAIPTDLATPFDTKYFKLNNKWLYGYKIDAEVVNKLSNNTNVINAVFSFVIDDSNTVKIVVHGASDKDNNALTDYFMLNDAIQINLTTNKNKFPPITNIEAQAWADAWHNNRSSTNTPTSLFHVLDTGIVAGEDTRLKCYAFDKKEVVSNYPVNVYFATHKHPEPRDISVSGRNLLNLIIHRDAPTSTPSKDEYYNLTYPCPPCCPCN